MPNVVENVKEICIAEIEQICMLWIETYGQLPPVPPSKYLNT
jgi:hypothetical protein